MKLLSFTKIYTYITHEVIGSKEMEVVWKNVNVERVRSFFVYIQMSIY